MPKNTEEFVTISLSTAEMNDLKNLNAIEPIITLNFPAVAH